MLCWVAGFSHISVCMAGASKIGHRAVRIVADTMSSEKPFAILAMMFAVAGATTTSCAPRASSTWGTSGPVPKSSV
jgi:hypothetical protein